MLAAGLAFPTVSGAASLAARIPRPLAAFSDALGESVARSLPLPAASAGFTYVFDPRTNVFERETALSAQLYLERAEPIGAGRWNVALVYQHVDLASYDGHDLDTAGFGRWQFGGFRFGGVRLSLTTDEIVPTVTVGVSEAVEVAATLPILVSDFTLRSGGLGVTGGPTLLDPQRVDETAAGVGDLVLRGKWRVLRAGRGSIALGLGLRLPTGSEDDFHGTGTPEVLPGVYWSSGPLATVGPARLDAHVNAGAALATDDVDRSEGRWGVGIDTGVGEWGALAVSVLGRHAVSGLAPGPTCGDLPRTLNATCAAREAGSGRVPVSAVGLSTTRPDFFDFSAGFRIRLWRETLLGLAAVVVPLNDDGFRPDPIPVVGLEAAF